MDPMTMAMLGSAAANIAGGVISGNAASKAADKAASQQRKMYEKNIALLEAIGIPSVEAQKIALESPDYVGDLVNEVLGPSAYEEIALDPQLRQNQMDVLAEYQQLADTGMGIQDRIALDQSLQKVQAQDQSRQNAIKSDMLQRGVMDSGIEAQMRMQASSQANQDAMNKALALAGQSQNTRLNALNAIASQSGNLENMDWNRGAQKASAADNIAQFNAQVRNQANQRNMDTKQNLANQASNVANQQEIHNKGLLQQDYLNRLNKGTAQIGLNTNYGNNQAANTLAAGQGQANMISGIASGVGNLATSYGQNSSQNQKQLADINEAAKKARGGI